MSKLKHLEFLQVSKFYSLHDFWTLRTIEKTRYFVVRDMSDVETMKGPDALLIPLSQIGEIPIDSRTEIHLSRQVIGLLLAQATATVELLQDRLEQSEVTLHHAMFELKSKIQKEEDAHIASVQKFAEQNHMLHNQNVSLEKTLEEMSGSLKKFETLEKNEKLRKKKDILDLLCKENDQLKLANEALEAQMKAHVYQEDLL